MPDQDPYAAIATPADPHASIAAPADDPYAQIAQPAADQTQPQAPVNPYAKPQEPEGYLHALGATVGVTPEEGAERQAHPWRTLAQGAGQAILGPVAGLPAAWQGVKRTVGQLQQADRSQAQGDWAGMAEHTIKAVPFVGSAIEQDERALPATHGFVDALKQTVTNPGILGNVTGEAPQAALAALSARDMAGAVRFGAPTAPSEGEILPPQREIPPPAGPSGGGGGGNPPAEPPQAGGGGGGVATAVRTQVRTPAAPPNAPPVARPPAAPSALESARVRVFDLRNALDDARIAGDQEGMARIQAQLDQAKAQYHTEYASQVIARLDRMSAEITATQRGVITQQAAAVDPTGPLGMADGAAYVNSVKGGVPPSVAAVAFGLTPQHQEAAHVANAFLPQTIGSLVKTPPAGPPAPPPPPVPQDSTQQQQQSQAQTIDEAAARAQAIQTQAAQLVAGVPPPKPPQVPLPAGMEQGAVTQETINTAGRIIMSLPAGKRSQAILESTGNLAQWMFGKKTVVGPDGKVVNVDSQKAAQTEAVQLINDEIDRQNEQLKARQDAQNQAQTEARKQAAKQAEEDAKTVEETRQGILNPEPAKPEGEAAEISPADIPNTRAVQLARAALDTASDDVVLNDKKAEALVRSKAAITNEYRRALIKEAQRKRVHRREDEQQMGMTGKPIPEGQSREELHEWATAVLTGEKPYMHVPLESDYKAASLRTGDFKMTEVRKAQIPGFNGRYFHNKKVKSKDVEKAASGPEPQKALDALFAPHMKPVEVQPHEVEEEKSSPAAETEAGTTGGKEPQEGEATTSAPGAQPVSSPSPTGLAPGSWEYEHAVYLEAMKAARARGVSPNDTEAWGTAIAEEEARIEDERKGGKPEVVQSPAKQNEPVAAKVEEPQTKPTKLVQPSTIKEIEERYAQEGVKAHIGEHKGTITLSRVVVPAEKRGQGIGTRFMQDLTALADRQGKVLALTPSTDFGGSSVARLKKFYGSFGFKENKGRSKDFTISESMMRQPALKPAEVAQPEKPPATGLNTYEAEVSKYAGDPHPKIVQVQAENRRHAEQLLAEKHPGMRISSAGRVDTAPKYLKRFDLGNGTEARMYQMNDGRYAVAVWDTDADKSASIVSYPTEEQATKAFEKGTSQSVTFKPGDKVTVKGSDGTTKTAEVRFMSPAGKVILKGERKPVAVGDVSPAEREKEADPWALVKHLESRLDEAKQDYRRANEKGGTAHQEEVEALTKELADARAEAAKAPKPKSDLGSTFSAFGAGALDPLATKLLQPVVDYTKKAAVNTFNEALRGAGKTGAWAKKAGREVVGGIYPPALADSEDLDIMGSALGEPAYRYFEASQILHAADKMFDGMSEEDRTAFIQRWEEGVQQPTDELRNAQKLMKGMQEAQREREQEAFNLGRSGILPELTDKANYFPHRWKVGPGREAPPTEAEMIASLGAHSRRPFEGSKAFMKQQRYSYAEAIEVGAKPIGNPVRQLLQRIQEGAKFVGARWAWYNFKAQGAAIFLKRGLALPEGFKYIEDKSANVWRMIQSIEETPTGENRKYPVQTGRWIMREDAARILNNYLSTRGWWDGAILTGLTKAKNFSTEVRLAISAFHWLYITTENYASAISAANDLLVNQGIRGGMDPTKLSAGLIALGESIIAPYTAIKRGGQVVQYARNPDEFVESPEGKKFIERYPDIPALMELAFKGGLRWDIAGTYKQSFGDRCLDAWKEGELGKGIGKLLPFLAHVVAKPLFEHYIPRSKWAFAVEMLSQKLSQYSQAIADGTKTPVEIARAVVETTENRFGELNWDSLYLNNSLRTTMQFFFRSATWKLGSWRGAGQAVDELIKGVRGSFQPAEFGDNMAAKVAAKYPADDLISRGRRALSRLPELGMNANWLISMGLVVSLLGGPFTYLTTGKSAFEWAREAKNGMPYVVNAAMELMHPRTGLNDAHGQPIRLSFPTGLKDYEHGIETPGRYIAGSESDLAINAWRTVANRDAYDNYVYNPHDPIWKEWEQGLAYNVKGDFLPMSVSNYLQAPSTANVGEKLLRSTGLVGGAPKFLDRSHALSEALDERRPHTPMTPEQEQAYQYTREHPTPKMIHRALKDKDLDYLERIVKYELSYPQAKAIYDDPTLTPEERKTLGPIMRRKQENMVHAARHK